MKNILFFCFTALTLLGTATVGMGCGEAEAANIVHVNKEDELNKILKKEKTVLVDFYADWCGPCVKLAPELEALAKEDPKLKIVKVNVDKAKELAKIYDISSIPALIVFKDGKKTNSSLGFQEKDKLKALITTQIKADTEKACCPH
jgi:thioredoxin 1